MRLDAIARVVQDAADHDLSTADMPENSIWILRKLALDIARHPALSDRGARLHVV